MGYAHIRVSINSFTLCMMESRCRRGRTVKNFHIKSRHYVREVLTDRNIKTFEI
jgi:hypothetical protein